MWEFETDPEFQEKLDWMETFVSEEVELLDALFPNQAFVRPMDPVVAEIIAPMKQKVKDMKLWACHLGPELGGEGYGQVKLALMNQILGRSVVGAHDLRHPGP